MEKIEVPFKALGGIFDDKDVDAALKVIHAAAEENGDFFPLPEETDFQRNFAEHEGAEYAVAVNSAGTALDVCMKVLGIKPGDEVITTPLSFVCTAGSPAAAGAKIVFADIEESTLNLDPKKVEKKITEKTKLIIPVHLSGLAADIDGFSKLSTKYNIPIVYDAAHAVGSKFNGKPIGSAGNASCYSFQSNKNMTCLGEGGMITTNIAEFAERARQLKTFGYVYGGKKLRVVSVGFNYRMTKPQYAVGLSQLKKIDKVINYRLVNMVNLKQLLSDVEEIILPREIKKGHGCHLFITRLNTDKVSYDRETFLSHLKSNYNVGTVIHYPIIWSWEAFNEVEYDNTNCEIAHKASKQVFSLPIFPNTSVKEVEYLAWSIKQSINDLR